MGGPTYDDQGTGRTDLAGRHRLPSPQLERPPAALRAVSGLNRYSAGVATQANTVSRPGQRRAHERCRHQHALKKS